MRRLAAIALLAFASLAWAQSAATSPTDSPVEVRLKALAEELRCLVCQNQTIADSNAPLAQDLRGQIREQVSQGRNDEQIRAYMVERYGDFVLYRPPFKATTALLWLGPLLLIGLGGTVFVAIVRRRRAAAEGPVISASRRSEIEALLGKD